MTTSTAARLLVRRPRRGLRTDPRVAALLAAAAAGLAVLAIVAASAPPPPAAAAPPRVALVVDAGARPVAALARARAAAHATERSGAADVAVRVPRTRAEAAADVRYFAAQRVVDRVVVVGPVAGAAARRAAADYPRARFEARPVVPRALG